MIIRIVSGWLPNLAVIQSDVNPPIGVIFVQRIFGLRSLNIFFDPRDGSCIFAGDRFIDFIERTSRGTETERIEFQIFAIDRNIVARSSFRLFELFISLGAA